jgi:Phosphodiester glycosidase
VSHVFRLFSAKTLLIGALATIVCLAGAALAGVYAYRGSYGINVLVRRGASLWVAVAADDPRLSTSMRTALRDPFGAVAAGPFAWRAVAQGFDVAELPVMAAGTEVDRILLARVDPARFRFVVRNAPAGNMELRDWMASLGAALVINGSYFSPNGTPNTPFVSGGVLSGPSHYNARHGAFVAAAGSAGIHDLANEDWRAALRAADDAMVSFPLLVTGDGKNRVKADWRWLANRSFVGQDADGRIIFGTTTDAFFSLKRLANFLRAAPLGLTIALNLDGGPVACQGIALKGFRRDFCGQWELAAYGGQLKSLTRAFGSARWALPIVLAVLPK